MPQPLASASSGACSRQCPRGLKVGYPRLAALQPRLRAAAGLLEQPALSRSAAVADKGKPGLGRAKVGCAVFHAEGRAAVDLEKVVDLEKAGPEKVDLEKVGGGAAAQLTMTGVPFQVATDHIKNGRAAKYSSY